MASSVTNAPKKATCPSVSHHKSGDSVKNFPSHTSYSSKDKREPAHVFAAAELFVDAIGVV